MRPMEYGPGEIPRGPRGDLRNEIAALFEATPPYGVPRPADSEIRRSDAANAAVSTALIDLLADRIASSHADGEFPATIGGYRLLRRIGRGGFGTVFLGQRETDDLQVAVKLAPKRHSEAYRAIRAEFESLARIAHPAIPKTLGFVEDRSFGAVIQQLIDGEPLRSRMDRRMAGESSRFVSMSEDQEPAHAADRRPPPRSRADVVEIVRLFRAIGSALQAVHDGGLIHQDVKPENIMIDRSGRPFLIDFGLAVDEDETLPDRVGGTIVYFSPEQVSLGRTGLTAASDLYSAAITFHEALTGVRVVDGRSLVERYHQVVNVAVAPPSVVNGTIDSGLDPIFARALQKDWQKRYRSAGELIEDLDRWLEGRRPTHAREAPLDRIRRFRRSEPRRFALVASLLILAVAAPLAYLAAKKRALDELEREVRALTRSGRFEAALEVIASDERLRTPASPIRELWIEAVDRVSLDDVERMIADGFYLTSGDLVPQAAMQPAGPDHPAAVMRRAAERAESRRKELASASCDAVLVVALERMIAGAAAEAKALLRSVPDAIGRSSRLRTVALMGATRLEDWAWRGELERLPTTSRSVATLVDLYLEAQLAIEEQSVTGNLPLERVKAADLNLEVLENRGQNFARFARARLKFQIGDFRGALDRLQSARTSGRTDVLGEAIIEAVVRFAIAVTSTPIDEAAATASWDTLVAAAARNERALIDVFSALGASPDLRVAVAALDRLLGAAGAPYAPPLPADRIGHPIAWLLHRANDQLAAVNRYDVMGALAARWEEVREAIEPLTTPAFAQQIHQHFAWQRWRSAEQALAEQRPLEAAKWYRTARELAARHPLPVPEDPRDDYLRLVDGLAAAGLSMATTDAVEKAGAYAAAKSILARWDRDWCLRQMGSDPESDRTFERIAWYCDAVR